MRKAILSEDQEKEIIERYKGGSSQKAIRKYFHICGKTVSMILKKNNIKKRETITDDTRRLLSNAAKKRIQKSNKIWTKPEKEFKTILNEVGLGVKFCDDLENILGVKSDVNASICFQYPLQRYICDFVDVGNKIVYQVNGDFWHANPLLYDVNNLTKMQKHNIHHDKNRRVYLEHLGYKVVDVWESEIYWNKDLVKFKIDTYRKCNTVNTNDWSTILKDLWFKRGKGRPKTKKIIKVCPVCKTEMSVNPSCRIIYCSNKCRMSATRKIVRPSKDELEKIVRDKSLEQIGREMGVTGKAIVKWCKAYGIDYKQCAKERNKEGKIIKKCLLCDNTFVVSKNNIYMQKKKYCSHFCAKEYDRINRSNK